MKDDPFDPKDDPKDDPYDPKDDPKDDPYDPKDELTMIPFVRDAIQEVRDAQTTHNHIHGSRTYCAGSTRAAGYAAGERASTGAGGPRGATARNVADLDRESAGG
jgi:hypothetical protein